MDDVVVPLQIVYKYGKAIGKGHNWSQWSGMCVNCNGILHGGTTEWSTILLVVSEPLRKRRKKDVLVFSWSVDWYVLWIWSQPCGCPKLSAIIKVYESLVKRNRRSLAKRRRRSGVPVLERVEWNQPAKVELGFPSIIQHQGWQVDKEFPMFCRMFCTRKLLREKLASATQVFHLNLSKIEDMFFILNDY